MTSHYFLERGLSAFIYCVFSLIVYFVLKKPGNTTIKVHCICLFLGIGGYFFIPSDATDLYRLWITADEYNQLSFFEMVERIYHGWTSPLGLIYVCTICRINEHLLPALTAFLFYENIFYIVVDCKYRKGLGDVALALTVFLFLSQGIYTEVISGIRSMLAFSFVTRCIYNEIYKKRSLIYNMPAYAFLALFHQAALVAIVIRFALKVVTDTRGVARVVYLIIVLAASGVFYKYNTGTIMKSVGVAEGYISGGGYYYFWEYLFNTFYMIEILYVVLKRGKIIPHSLEWNDVLRFLLLHYGICLSLVKVYSIYHRYILYASMLGLLLVEENLSYYYNNNNKTFLKNVFVISVIFMGLSCIKGNLNGYRLFTFTPELYNL